MASRMASQPGSRASNGRPKGNLGVDDRGVALRQYPYIPRALMGANGRALEKKGRYCPGMHLRGGRLLITPGALWGRNQLASEQPEKHLALKSHSTIIYRQVAFGAAIACPRSRLAGHAGCHARCVSLFFSTSLFSLMLCHWPPSGL